MTLMFPTEGTHNSSKILKDKTFPTECNSEYNFKISHFPVHSLTPVIQSKPHLQSLVFTKCLQKKRSKIGQPNFHVNLRELRKVKSFQP